jgi:hypothetical protein
MGSYERTFYPLFSRQEYIFSVQSILPLISRRYLSIDPVLHSRLRFSKYPQDSKGHCLLIAAPGDLGSSPARNCNPMLLPMNDLDLSKVAWSLVTLRIGFWPSFIHGQLSHFNSLAHLYHIWQWKQNMTRSLTDRSMMLRN